MTLVIRITPHRIERTILLLIILFFILSSSYYANKYYDTTSEDSGYLDKLYSGTFFAKIPTELEITTPENNISDDTLNVTNISNMNVTEEVLEVEDETNSTNETNTTTPEEDTPCTDADFKVISFNTQKIDDDSDREGIIQAIRLSYCNMEDTESYMMAEIYLWDELDKELDLVDSRKNTPRYTTLQTVSIMPGEKYSKEYIFPTSKIKTVWYDSEFNYRIRFYYVDEDGDKIDTTAIKSISSTYTIK
ncbi:MAG: hypothetical protein KAI26_09750 [Nanoarchaeota archaeon]|nr:hypothetical protein [Nanoarchaeota archaeon]